MRSIFLDTSFWFSLYVANDGRHEDAVRTAPTFEGSQLVSTNLILGETWTLLRSRGLHADSLAAIDAIRSSGTYFIHVGTALEDEAFEWLRRHDERKYSFVDATSFALMRSLEITEAASFDRDFEAAGFTLLS